jgi:hypothetical protein
MELRLARAFGTHFFDDDTTKAMSHKYKTTTERGFPSQCMKHVFAVSEDATFVRGSHHILCNFGIVAVHKNPRIRTIFWEQICRPEGLLGLTPLGMAPCRVSLGTVRGEGGLATFG